MVVPPPCIVPSSPAGCAAESERGGAVEDTTGFIEVGDRRRTFRITSVTPLVVSVTVTRPGPPNKAHGIDVERAVAKRQTTGHLEAAGFSAGVLQQQRAGIDVEPIRCC